MRSVAVKQDQKKCTLKTRKNAQCKARTCDLRIALLLEIIETMRPTLYQLSQLSIMEKFSILHLDPSRAEDYTEWRNRVTRLLAHEECSSRPCSNSSCRDADTATSTPRACAWRCISTRVEEWDSDSNRTSKVTQRYTTH